jgi:hypothetical protein
MDPLLLGPVAAHALLPRAIGDGASSPRTDGGESPSDCADGCPSLEVRQGLQSAVAHPKTRAGMPGGGGDDDDAPPISIGGELRGTECCPCRGKGCGPCGIQKLPSFFAKLYGAACGTQKLHSFFAKLYGAPLGSCEMVCLKNYRETLDEK